MRVILISDNHYDWSIVESTLKSEQYDIAIHLGDAEVSEKMLSKWFSAYVGGNHDFGFKDYERIIEIDNVRIGLTHGHLKGVSALNYSYTEVLKWAKEHDLQAVFHGHTHIPSDHWADRVRVICPGSIAQPRSHHGPTYAIVEIDGSEIKSVQFKHPK